MDSTGEIGVIGTQGQRYNNNNNRRKYWGNNKKAPKTSYYPQHTSSESSSDSDSSNGSTGAPKTTSEYNRKTSFHNNKNSHNNNINGRKRIPRRSFEKSNREEEVGGVGGGCYLSPQERKRFVALDCEMVGIGPCEYQRSSLARVTIVDWNGTILLDEFVRQEENVEITDYRTFVSGITPEILEIRAKIDLETCRILVKRILENKILVGHGLKNDLRALGVSHPWHMTRDTAKYEPFMKVRFNDGILWPRGLKELMKTLLNRDIQTYGIPHSPHEDAVAALDLYRSASRKWEKAMEYKVQKTRRIQQQNHHHCKQ